MHIRAVIFFLLGTSPVIFSCQNPFAKQGIKNWGPQSKIGVRKSLSSREQRERRVAAEFKKYQGYGPIYSHIVEDIIRLNLNLISWQTYKIAVGTFPFYVAARMGDEEWHKHFYCRKRHKNLNQFPKWCDKFAQFGLSIPLIALGSLAFLGVDDEMKMTGWIFILGFPFLVFGNKINKKIQFEGCHRPWHEQFSCVKRAGGGFPSGHMSEITYMAALFGLRYGPKWGLPLAAYGLFVGVDFWVSNRHYASQLIAGVAWGLMYAFAADRYIDTKLCEKRQLAYDLGFDKGGNPAVSVSYSW